MKTILKISKESDNRKNKTDLYKCHFCPQNMELYEIEKHFKTFHKFRSSHDEYYCEFCDSDEVFHTKDDLLEHIHSIQHIAEKAIPESKMECLDEGKLKFLHLMSNFKSQKDAFSTRTYLKIHIETIERRIAPSFVITYCGKFFPTVQILRRHIHTVHEGHKDYKCEACGKSYSTAQYLKEHIHTVHDGHKDYKCDSCGKSFPHAGYLKKHIRTIHEGRKDHKCESCGKYFAQAGDLKKHIHRVHEGRKDYKCEPCGKRFSQAQHLKRHTHTVHEHNKDFKCKSCGKSFSQAGNLKKHIQIIHESHY